MRQTQFSVPDAPANIKALPLNEHAVIVSWLPPALPNGQLISYTLYMKTMEDGQQSRQEYAIGPNTTTYTLRGLHKVMNLLKCKTSL